jgi:hypothetical protein
LIGDAGDQLSGGQRPALQSDGDASLKYKQGATEREPRVAQEAQNLAA